MQLRVALGVVLLVLAGPAVASQDQVPAVEVPGGTVMGSDVAGDIVFRGIPYAAPPLGDLRWRPPAPVVPWQGMRDATRQAPACLQKSEGWNVANYRYSSEDCLTLDIRTPSMTGKRPVMVWIHGGSNRSGSAGGPADSDMPGVAGGSAAASYDTFENRATGAASTFAAVAVAAIIDARTLSRRSNFISPNCERKYLARSPPAFYGSAITGENKQPLMALFLASDDARYCTAHNYWVDAGWR